MNRIAIALALLWAGASWTEEAGVLTLRQAVARALAESPALAPYSIDDEIAEARILQAGLRPNPVLGLEVEDVRLGGGPGESTRTVSVSRAGGGGLAIGAERERVSGAGSGFSEAELTLSLSQVVELGGKRAKRIAVAEREQALAAWDFERARADLAAEVGEAFCRVLEAQERVQLTRALMELASDVDESIGARVDAGDTSPLERNRSTVALSNARIAKARAERELDLARLALAATWGADSADFGTAGGALEAAEPLAPLPVLQRQLDSNPDIARWSEEMAAHEARVALAQSQRTPDPELMVGYRNRWTGDRTARRVGIDSTGGLNWSRSDAEARSERDDSFVLGLSIPLPIFDRNQGNIAEAELGIAKAGAQERHARTRAASLLARAHGEASSALAELRALHADVEALAEETLAKTRQGYELGKFTYLDVLDAQRALFDSRDASIDAHLRYRLAVIAIERLTGALPYDETTDDASR